MLKNLMRPPDSTLSGAAVEKSRRPCIDSLELGSVYRKSLEERRLRVLSRITKVAEADSHQTKSLSGIEAHLVSQ